MGGDSVDGGTTDEDEARTDENDAATGGEDGTSKPTRTEPRRTGEAPFLAGTTCDYDDVCEPLDLAGGDHLVSGVFSSDAQCHMDALRMGRPGLLQIRDRGRLWMVFNQTEGPGPVVYFEHADDPSEAPTRCALDMDFLQRCRAPDPSCLRPENWAAECEPVAFDCPAPPTPMKDCRPSAGPPRWLEEGDTLEVSLVFACENGDEVPGSDVRFQALPDGASYDPDTGLFRWTPGLDQAATYDLVFRLEQTGEPGELRVGVADAFDAPDNEPIADPSRYLYEYGLPVFFLEDPEQDEYTPSALTYAGRRYRSMRIKIRGRNSRVYPKHSYTLKFPWEDLFQEPNREDGMIDRKKLVLTTSFDDNSYIRQRLAHTMWRLLDPEHIPVRTYPAVVYRDNEFRGLYTVTDHVDRHMMRYNGLSDEGELFKSVEHAGNFLTQNHLMEKKEGLPLQGEPGWDESLQQVIRLVVLSSDDEFLELAEQHLDVRDYQHWWIFMMATGASDSTGKNVYHYKENREAPFRLIPWDFNETFGQDWRTYRAEQRIPRWRRNGIWMRMLAHPTFHSQLRERATAALQGPYELEGILARLDAYWEAVEPVARRDWRRWETEYKTFPRWNERQDFTDPGQEIEYMRTWLRERWAFFEANVDQLFTPVDINEVIPAAEWASN